MADFVFNEFKGEIMKGTIDLQSTGDQIKVSLHTAAPGTADTDGYASLSNEHGATGNYATGGVSLTKANQSVTVSDANDWAYYDCTTDASWSSATISAAYAVVYDDTHAGKCCICCFDFGGTKSSTNGTFTVVFSADGIVRIA